MSGVSEWKYRDPRRVGGTYGELKQYSVNICKILSSGNFPWEIEGIHVPEVLIGYINNPPGHNFRHPPLPGLEHYTKIFF